MTKRRNLLGFSLVEVTLAIGVAGFCLIAVLGLLPISAKTNHAAIQQTTANRLISEIAADLNAAARFPPGLVSKQFDLPDHWNNVRTPDQLYFTNDGKQTGSVNATAPPADAVFVATITYRTPPTDTTSLADIRISWPAAQPNPAEREGSVEMFVAINR